MVREGLYPEIIKSKHHIGLSDFPPITNNRRSTYSMKKYYQVALIAVALVSVLSLLLYRHEYNRLRYVLEVLNFYGKPGTNNMDLNCSTRNSSPLKLDLLLNSPLPTWQRLNDDLFVYSAYRVSQNEIKAIAFGKAYDSLNINCNVFFEGDASVLGNLRYSKFNEDTEYTGYQLSCEYTGSPIPEGVAFFNGEKSSGNKAPIINVRDAPQSLMTNEITLCVAPPLDRSISRKDMISFLNFHQIIGVGHFIIYDHGVSSRFSETVRDIVVSRGLNFTFTILPWNFPFSGVSSDIIKGIVERDCLYRSYNKIEYSATLHWEEYMVLKYHHTLLELLDDFETTMRTTDCYQLETSVFCTQQRDNKEATDRMPIIFRKTHRLTSDSVITNHVRITKPHKNLNLDSSSAVKANSDLINVNLYQYCSNSRNEISEIDDKSILRFAKDMLDTPFYKEYITRESLSIK